MYRLHAIGHRRERYIGPESRDTRADVTRIPGHTRGRDTDPGTHARTNPGSARIPDTPRIPRRESRDTRGIPGTPGVCNRGPCQRVDADAAEGGQIIYCENGQVMGLGLFRGSNKCDVQPSSPHRRSCLAGGSKRTGCNLTGTHSHPYFIYERDMNLKCNGT